jgi:uncharacterized membrane protein HdeD (DUF308 family)
MATPKHPWWVTLIQGVFAFIVGAILLWAPAKDKVETWQVLIALLGFYWLVLGIIDIVRIFSDSTGWGWKLFTGIISILAGGYILMYPVASALLLPSIFVLVLGIWGIMYGIVFLLLAFRGGGWGAAILGVLGIIFGLILVVNYSAPGMGLSLVWTAAVAGLIGGIIMMVQAFQEKNATA